VGKIVVKAVCGSVFSAMWHCILSAELTKTHYLLQIVFWWFCPPGVTQFRKMFVRFMKIFSR